MDYPLKLSFKIWTFVPQFTISDVNDNPVYYVRQKIFKLREKISVFKTNQRENQLYTINADRIIDFSAKYHFTDMQQQYLGSVKRKGLKSLWRAHYLLFDGEQEVGTIREESVFVRFMDNLFSSIPVIGLCAGYLFHPTYVIRRMDGTEIMRIRKTPALFEGKFIIEKFAELSDQEEKRCLLGLMMMVLLERARG
jgi:uncharacterized protein YxjI